MTKKQSPWVFRELHLTWEAMVRYLIQCSISCNRGAGEKAGLNQKDKEAWRCGY